MSRGFRLLQSLPATFAIGLIAVLYAPAAGALQTIDDIIKKGTIVVGVSTTTPIFGLIGQQGEPEGYDPDVARLLAKYLGVKVDFVPVTGANRIPQLLSGRVDVLICLFGITPERAQQVWYSIPYAYEAATLVAPAALKVGTGLLVNQRLNRNNPGKDYQVKIVLRPLHFGIGIRRGEIDKLQWLNTFIYTIKNNGELDAISRKWRERPLEDLPVF